MTSPAYIETYESGELSRRAAEAVAGLAACDVCPRDCGVDRLANEQEVCRIGRQAQISSAQAHFGEEDCLRGRHGSGTIFFSGCNLGCVFCQNWETSRAEEGRELDARQLASVMLALQERGCHNINFVTPEHVVPQILEALPHAIEHGLSLPLVYNTSAYDGLHSLRLLDGVVDIYMPDFKIWDLDTSHKLLKARDYPSVARAALLEMNRQVGPLELDEDGIARRGVLVRHLVMPGGVEDSTRILRWLAEEVDPQTYVNVMGQYHPAGHAAQYPERYAEIARAPRAEEFAAVVDVARKLGLRE